MRRAWRIEWNGIKAITSASTRAKAKYRVRDAATMNPCEKTRMSRQWTIWEATKMKNEPKTTPATCPNCTSPQYSEYLARNGRCYDCGYEPATTPAGGLKACPPDQSKYKIVARNQSGKGHIFSLETNNILCSRGGRSGESNLGLYVEADTVTCENCLRQFARYFPNFVVEKGRPQSPPVEQDRVTIGDLSHALYETDSGLWPDGYILHEKCLNQQAQTLAARFDIRYHGAPEVEREDEREFMERYGEENYTEPQRPDDGGVVEQAYVHDPETCGCGDHWEYCPFLNAAPIRDGDGGMKERATTFMESQGFPVEVEGVVGMILARKDALKLIVDFHLSELSRQAPAAEGELVERLRMEAQGHAIEARAQRATVREIYQVVTGATGEPGDWNGANPVRERIDRLTAMLEHARACLMSLTTESGNDPMSRQMQKMIGEITDCLDGSPARPEAPAAEHCKFCHAPSNPNVTEESVNEVLDLLKPEAPAAGGDTVRRAEIFLNVPENSDHPITLTDRKLAEWMAEFSDYDTASLRAALDKAEGTLAEARHILTMFRDSDSPLAVHDCETMAIDWLAAHAGEDSEG